MFRQMIKPEDIYKIKSDPTYYLGYYPEKYWNWDACMEIMGLFDNPKSFFFGNNDGEFRWNILKEHLGSIREVLLMPGMYPRLQGLGQNYYEIDNMEYPTDDAAQSKYKKAEWTVITNCVQLQAMANNPSGKYYLDRDIDCTFCTQNPAGALYNGGLGFNPVSLLDGGEFDGDGFTITGLKVNRPLEYGLGLFGTVARAKVRNVTLNNFIILGRGGAALVSGSQESEIINCHSSGIVTITNPWMAIDGGAGGLISFNGSSNVVSECSSSCSVTDTSGAGIAGGLIGYMAFSSVNNSSATGLVTGYNKGGFASFERDPVHLNHYSGCTWNIGSSGCAHALSVHSTRPDPPGIVGV